jgi:polysaccharide biosynthesis protein PslA
MTHFAYPSSRMERAARRHLVVPWSLFALLIASGELALVAGSSWATGAAYFALAFGSVEASAPHALFGLFVAIALVLIAALRGHYDFETFLSASLWERAIVAWSAAFLLALAGLFLLKAGGEVSRIGTVGFSLIGLVLVGAWRCGLRGLAVNGLRRGWIATRRVMLIGSQSEIGAYVKRLDPDRHGVAVVGAAAVAGDDPNLAAAVERARALRPDAVIMLAPWSSPAAIERWVDALMAVPTTIHLGPPPGLGRFGQLPLARNSVLGDLILVRAPLSRGEQLAKRLFDVVAAGLALVVLAPVMLAIALAIRLDSAGPALFRQPRHGFNNDIFEIYKFRTMVRDAEANGFRQAVPAIRG